MASIKVKFSPSSVVNHEGTIYYQIIHQGRSRQLFTGFHLLPNEWDGHSSTLILGHDPARRSMLLSLRDCIRCDVERLKKIVSKLDGNALPYTSDDVIDEFHRFNTDYTLFNYMECLINRLKHNGKTRTTETYTAARNSFRTFLAGQKSLALYRLGDDISLDRLNSWMLAEYESWHRQRGNSLNTISFYTRILRAVYNRAVEDEIIENRHPFRHVYTGVEKTVKRALPISIIKKIKAMELAPASALDFARDMFMMSFMLRGMSFIDMAFLKKSDLHDGYITYRRRKTGQRLTIKWTREMKSLLAKYPENNSDYLLPIIRNSGTNERFTYRNVGYNINHNLKVIGQKVGITIPLTLYVARHSWASAAKAKGIPLSVISEGMGHDSETTTRIYLASLDTSVVDRANSLILSSL